MLDLTLKKILVTGGRGFLGTHVVKQLKKQGCKHIFVPTSSEFDLTDPQKCREIVKNQDIVVHLAAYVGGIGLNKEHPGKLFYDNAVMGIHLLEEARIAGVKKFLTIGTACSYPKYCPVPFVEENLWAGYPDEITGVYGMAKKMLLVQSQAYRQEFGFNAIFLIPVNLYGPYDNFDPEYGHVIPSLVRRMIEARKKRSKTFTVWGTGTATREFLYVEDCAEAIVEALINYDQGEPVNLGTGREISIRDLVELLKELVGFKGEIVWDVTKPDGQPRRAVDVNKAKNYFGFSAKIDLRKGLEKTINWYVTKIQN